MPDSATGYGGYDAPGTGTPGPASNGVDADYWDPTERATAAGIYEEMFPRAVEALVKANIPSPAANQAARAIATNAANTYLADRRAGVAPGPARQKAEATYSAQVTAYASQNNVTADATAPGQHTTAGDGENPIDRGDVKNAQQQFVEGISKGKETFQDILANATNKPGARSTFKPIETPSNVAAITAPKVGSAAQQLATTVRETDTADLNATARGQGAGQQSAAARYKSLLLDQSRNMNGTVQQLRGKDRAAGRLAAMSNQGEAGVAAGAKIAESDAQTSLAAQTKVADISSQRNALQAQLDEAKAAGDANRVQEITRKIADLEQDTSKTNAGIDDGNKERAIGVQEKNNAGGLAAEVAGSDQDIAQADLRIRATKALEDSARGLLSEDQRQEGIKNAKKEIALAEQRYRDARDDAERNRASQDRSFWTTTLTSFIALGVTAVGGPAAGAAAGAAGNAIARAAHGGAVNSPSTVLMGEAGNAEVIIPVKGKLSQRLAQALSIDAKPFDDPSEDGEIDTADELTAAIKKTLGNFRAKMGKKVVDDGEDAVNEMAAATLRSRRGRGAA